MAAMSPRVRVSLVSLFAVGTAYAQAPGEYAAPPPQSMPAPEPPAPPPQRPERRLSIGVGVGQMELTSGGYTSGGYDDQRQTFNIGELAVRYRLLRHLELELSFGGGREYLVGGYDGTSAVAWGTLAARYRFNPQDHWNWWLLAGGGQTIVAPRDATRDRVNAAARVHGVIGIGLEHRWDHVAIQLELRGIATGATKSDRDLADQYGYAEGPGLSGGQFSLGAGYYF
jgi:hypothetical protein